MPFDLDAGQGRWRVDLSVWLRDLHAHVARWLAGNGFPKPGPGRAGCRRGAMIPPRDVVRRGYDALSYRYRGHDEEPEHYATWRAQLRRRVRAGGSVLDLGCGCGVPLARDLAGDGYEVTGVDLGAVQSGVLRERVAQ